MSLTKWKWRGKKKYLELALLSGKTFNQNLEPCCDILSWAKSHDCVGVSHVLWIYKFSVLFSRRGSIFELKMDLKKIIQTQKSYVLYMSIDDLCSILLLIHLWKKVRPQVFLDYDQVGVGGSERRHLPNLVQNGFTSGSRTFTDLSGKATRFDIWLRTKRRHPV